MPPRYQEGGGGLFLWIINGTLFFVKKKLFEFTFFKKN